MVKLKLYNLHTIYFKIYLFILYGGYSFRMICFYMLCLKNTYFSIYPFNILWIFIIKYIILLENFKYTQNFLLVVVK